MQVSQVLARPPLGHATAHKVVQLGKQHGWPSGLALDHSVQRCFEDVSPGYILAGPACKLLSVGALLVAWDQLHTADSLGAGNHSAVEDTAPTEPVAQALVSVVQVPTAV